MTAIVPPDIDRSTVDELRKRIPNLPEIELPTLPSMQGVGKTADQTIDRLLGRRKGSVWPWVAAAIAVATVVGVIAAYFAWFRRPSWEAQGDAWSSEPISPEPDMGISTTELADRPIAAAGLEEA